MLKKILLLSIIIFNLSHCGFTPLYKTNDLNFKITLENFEGDQDLNNYIRINLERYSKQESGKNFKIQTNSKYTKNITAKDSKGTATDFELIANVSFNIFFEDKNYLYSYQESFRTQKNSNFYKDREYEQNIKKNLAELISKKILIQLLTVK